MEEEKEKTLEEEEQEELEEIGQNIEDLLD